MIYTESQRPWPQGWMSGNMRAERGSAVILNQTGLFVTGVESGHLAQV